MMAHQILNTDSDVDWFMIIFPHKFSRLRGMAEAILRKEIGIAPHFIIKVRAFLGE
jgi:hypothetical protein